MTDQAPRRPASSTPPRPRGIRLGQIAGVQVIAHLPAFVLPALLAYSMASGGLPTADHQPNVVVAIAAVLGGAGLLASLVVHELAHALTARRYGIPTTFITLWLLGGFAETSKEAETPRAEIRIALAGPLASLGLAVGVGAIAFGANAASGWPAMVTALAWLASANAVLGVLNLLPGSPLDGGRVLRGWLWRRSGDRLAATIQAGRAGVVLAWALIGLAVLQFTQGDAGGMFTALIGWFLLTAARQEQLSARIHQRLNSVRLRDVLSPPTIAVNDWWSVAEVVTAVSAQPPRPLYLLRDFDGRLTGVVTLAALGAVPVDDRTTTRVRALAAMPVDTVVASPDETLSQVLERLTATRPALLAVQDENGVLLGTASPTDIASVSGIPVPGGNRAPAAHAFPPPPPPPPPSGPPAG